MIYQPASLNRLIRSLTESLEEDLIKTGVFYRIFYRAKSLKSLTKKLEAVNHDGSKKYNGQDKFLRDLIGIRINLYFVDDLEILLNFFKAKYHGSFLEEAVDVNNDTEFKPTRVNLIFALPEDLKTEFRSVIQNADVDATFELQMRTIFSEGWHEVEHDFRYKCQNDWITHTSLSRTFNGMLAALETHEWGIIKLFEEMAYSHYKDKNHSAMIRMKLRIRTEDLELSNEVIASINEADTFIKDFFKLDRQMLIDFLLTENIRLPFTVDNLVYLINYFFIKNDVIANVTPSIILNDFSKIHGLQIETILEGT